MNSEKQEKSIVIIGAGFAGLAAGIYARMNGYDATIYEMHDKPGGLCTSWTRKGYTFDGCIHWLVGSSPKSAMHDFWEEVGLIQDRKITDMEEYLRFESSDGRVLTLYTDIGRLEKQLLEFSPQDEIVIKEFTKGIRMCLPFNTPSRTTPLIKRLGKLTKLFFMMLVNGSRLQKWMKTSAKEFADRFKDPVLREAFKEIWFPEFSMAMMLFTFAYLHERNAGYPAGGSMPMSRALEERFIRLGGKINYRHRVNRIVVENDQATGVVLDDSTEIRAGRVISAADGYATIFFMLEGKYTDEKIKQAYEKWPLFPPLIYAGFGVNRDFNDLPKSVSGISLGLKEPVIIAEKPRHRLWIHAYNHDPSMAPAGKTSLIIMLETDYDYWKKLSLDRVEYERKKEETEKILISQLELRFPGISSQIEASDIATPLTFERYTGNWKGSFEGWMITPENSYTLMKPMSQVLPGLKRFYMCGQWIMPGGGLPTGIMTARKLIKNICHEDGKKFQTMS